MTDFTNSQGTGTVQSDGFTSPVASGPPGQASGPAKFPAGLAGQPSVAPTFVAGAGSTQLGATQLLAGSFNVASVTQSSEGLLLPVNVTGEGLWVFAPLTKAVKVYPKLHCFIDASASNVSILLAAAKGAFFYSEDASHWRTVRGA
jgi:hypothetical protein